MLPVPPKTTTRMPAAFPLARTGNQRPLVEDWICDHWAETQANWDGDTPRLQWHATLGEVPGLSSFVEQLRPHLERGYLEPVGARWLHLTVHDVDASPDDRRGELERLVEAAKDLCGLFPPLRLRLGPPRLVKTAVVLQASPHESIWQLRKLLRAADVRVRGSRATPLADGPASPPHVSIAYARRAANADHLAETLAALVPKDVEVEIPNVELLRLYRNYTWEAIASVEFHGQTVQV